MKKQPGPELVRLRALKDLIWQSTIPVNIPALLNTGLRTALQATNASAGCIRLLEEGDQLVLTSSYGTESPYLTAKPVLSAHSEPLQSALGGDGPYLLPLDKIPEIITDDHPHGVAVLTPLVAAGRAHGLLILSYPSGMEPPPPVQEWLGVVGSLLGTALVNSRLYEQTEIAARTDPLTELNTRLFFDTALRRELARARRTGAPVSVALLDVDDLKQINDRWGHRAGDAALRVVSDLLRNLRATDVAARYGGDEFVVLLPDTDHANAQAVAARIRTGLAAINEARRFPFTLNVSIGVRQLSAWDQDIIAEADAAMYAEKRQRLLQQKNTNSDQDVDSVFKE